VQLERPPALRAIRGVFARRLSCSPTERGESMSETIKCACPNCGAKYRLPVEAQGRAARCKKCGNKFAVPREQSLEDSVLAWLNEPEAEEEELAQPRVISMDADAADAETSKRARGPIRMRAASAESE
jgi:hypothetical protein